MTSPSGVGDPISELGHSSRAGAGSFRFFRISYGAIELSAASIDAFSIVLASVIGGVAYHLSSDGYFGDVGLSVGIGIGNSVVYGLLAKAWGLYGLPALVTPRRYLVRIVTAWAGVFLLFMLVIFLIKAGTSLSRGAFVSFAGIALVFLVLTRVLTGKYLVAAMAAGAVRGRRAILIGNNQEFAGWGPTQLLRNFGIQEIARVVLGKDGIAAGPVEQGVDEAIELARTSGAEELVLALTWNNTDLLALVRDRLRRSPLPVRLLPCAVVRTVFEMRAAATSPLIMLDLQRAPLTRFEQMLKRAFDIVFATASLILVSPMLFIVALAIKFESPGPVIFRQRRNGFNGHPFVIFKFRTMRVLEDGLTVQQAQREDPRITRIGRILRQWSIDELPQLLNVIRGDMSLVGPRPHALAHDSEYMELVRNYAFRHHVKPGITGWAQVNGYRGETPELNQMVERVELDLWYVNNWSLLLDLRVVLRTCIEVVKGRAY